MKQQILTYYITQKGDVGLNEEENKKIESGQPEEENEQPKVIDEKGEEFENIKKENSEEIHHYKIKKKKTLKKILAISIVVVSVLYLGGKGLDLLKDNMKKDRQEKFEQSLGKTNLIFYPVNYNENIFENEEYMGKNRGIRYTVDQESYYIKEEEGLNTYSYEFEFMAKIIYHIIRGESEEYYSNFVENYAEVYPDMIRERFTMQKLYNIEMEIIDQIKGDTVEDYYYLNTDFKVGYNILKNNGTFRNDLPEEVSIPVVYKIWSKYKTGSVIPEEIKIYEVIDYSKYSSGLYD